ncbi:MAG: class I SAM-dependent methyltransferase [Alphaproteobacteria bacterium]|nr:class I SAM-dependent methyltransferase [Alphaproteobacteria bacterium]
MIPWRLKNVISDKFPLAYHKIINFRQTVNSDEYWDNIYQTEWDSEKRIWPTKNIIIKDNTKKTDAILDIACGTGSILRFLKDNDYKDLHGTEISNLCIERLEDLGVSMFKSILPTIECNDNRFDIVIASQILEHIIKRDKFLSEIKRVTKPGGQCFIFVPDDCLGPIDEPSHVIKFNQKSLTKLIGKYFNNFTVTSIKDENFEMPILFAHIKN